MYSAKDIAAYVVWRENGCDRSVNNLRLQKLLYFIQAQFLVDTGGPCFDDEMQAWDIGPVVPSVYHEYKYFGSSSIPLHVIAPFILGCCGDMELIDHILDRCAEYRTSDLMYITHRQTPWMEARRRWPDHVILNQDIRRFFEG